MSRPALINLVRTSTVYASNENDYTAAGELYTRHDEIKLVDPDGDPCAVPMQPREDNIDYRYDYVTGARGHTLRGTLIEQDLSIDYIEGDVDQLLRRWKRERARCMVAANMGRNTLFSWRAVDVKGNYFNGGPPFKDLTGNHGMSATCTQYLRYWDAMRRLFIPKSTSNRAPLVLTPGGAGLVGHPTVVNRMVPTYPKTATLSSAATEAGWLAGGASAADISAALKTDFGQTDCPNYLRVTVAGNVATDRYLYASNQFNSAHADYAGYSFINSVSAVAVVWLRGKMPDGSYLAFGSLTGSDYSQVAIGSRRLDGWTPIMVQHSPTDWATNKPTLWITLPSTSGSACSFDLGPTMVYQLTGYGSSPASPVWTPQVTGGTTSGTPQVATTAAVTLPGQGTLITSFYVPSDWTDSWRKTAACGLWSNTNLRLRAGITGTTEYITLNQASPSLGVTYTETTRGNLFVAGKINTVAVTWGTDGQKIYVNGTLVVTKTAAADTAIIGGSSSAMLIGADSGGYCCSPLAVLTCRIDEGAMTADEVAQIHTALTDPIARALALSCAGRTFEITGTPQMMRSAVGGSQIVGTLTVRQVDYNQFADDPFSKESSVV